jgi:hypothetical protein
MDLELIRKYDSPRRKREGVKKLKYFPSPARGRGGIYWNSVRNSFPLDGGGAGWGWKMDFFTPSGGLGRFSLRRGKTNSPPPLF